MQVTVAQGETLLDRMARLIDSAQASKPKLQKLADRVAAVFVPAVCVIALATFAGWLLVHAPLATAVINAVSVLVIACPCALGLATPAAIMAGTGMAAKHGILIRNADAIEQAASVDVVVFDKTGTLTLGHPALTGTHLFGRMPGETVMAIAAALAAGDTHPLAVPLRRPGAAPAENIRALPGRGIEGNVAGARFILGSRQLIEEAGGAAPDFDAPGATISYLATADGHVLAAFTFADQLRPGAKAAIAQLQARNIHVALLSGDRRAAAAPIAAALGITDITADASPAQKLAAIDAWRAAGRVVAMVGDGVNDGPALAAANIGLAIGTGADVAIETADFSLLRPEPKLVADALVLSKRIWRTLREGLFWAVIYNVVGIPLAAFGYLSPTAAGAAMAASSVCVLANALRLRNWRPS
jgi:Cu+-exporting ATPase